MAAMFLAMVWYAVRRQAAVEEAGRLAATEHRLLEGQRDSSVTPPTSCGPRSPSRVATPS